MSGRPVDPGRSRIILVGTPAYRDPQLPDVPVVASNIADLAAAFTDPRIGGFDPSHCVRASAAAGMAEIGDLLVRAASEAEDLLLFYYSGHGLLGTRSHELYLSLAGTRLGQVPFTALPFAAVRDACLESRAASRVVILDSCFSGRAIGETLGTDDEILGQVEVKGTYTLTSAPANRTALILPGEKHTAFTERLLRLLHDGSPQAGDMLSLGDIYRHLHARLRAEGLPAPQQRGTETADLLGLVRNSSTLREGRKDRAEQEVPQPAADRTSQFATESAFHSAGAFPRSMLEARSFGRGPAIILWGAPASGKTTFLAALNIAVQRSPDGWNLMAANAASEAMLAKTAADLTGKGTFPEASLQPEAYEWVLEREAVEMVRRRFRKERAPQTARIHVILVDVPEKQTGHGHDELIRLLADARGILYMFDPIREFEIGDAYERISGVCNSLGHAMTGGRSGFGARLPHYLAVCITKFDEIRVLEAAQEAHQLNDAVFDYFPSVRNAREFFRRLSEKSAGRNGDMVIPALERYFHPERIKYFVTSAIGFYTDPRSPILDLDGFQNVTPVGAPPHDKRVLGSVRPVNVAEPLLWITQQVSWYATGTRVPR